MSLLRKSQLKQTQKPLLQPSNLGLEDSDLIIDDEVTYGRNRRSAEFGKLVDEAKADDTELSDQVKFRLWLARQLAMARYKEKWG